MVQNAVANLVQYALSTNLIEKEDAVWAANRLLKMLETDELSEEAEQAVLSWDPADESIIPRLPQILEVLCDEALAKGLIEEDSVTRRDLFDTELMGVLTERPSGVTKKFYSILENEGARAATDWYYRFSCDTNYIRRDRIAKDVRWLAPTPYGDMDITINLSKPEKDPRAIAAAKFAKQSAYPKCQLCYENVGYAGRLNHPARANHRVIPITIDGQPWCLQYSP